MVSSPESTEELGNFLPDDFYTTIQVEPVGRWFLSHWDRLHGQRGLSESVSADAEDGDSSDDSSDGDDEEETEVEFEDDLGYLRSLDPKECKDQDHYKVLGIPKLRHRATEEQIRKAYRFKVLKHHPDKRRAAGEEIREDDDYFTCITKAAEILGNPVKRRAYDSVDPEFDDSVPDPKKTSAEDFFQVFGPVFDRNARWSAKKHVPKLGDNDLSRDKVDRFYKFWYSFESWREYSYLDEEDKEKGSDRDERRWIEKNNRIERAERKKEEMRRIRKLVDGAYAADPRIARFREEDRMEKAAKKKAKQDAARARREEEERAIREQEEKERAKKEAEAAEAKAKQEEARKERESAKKALKERRKAVRNTCKENGFFAKDEADKVQLMSDVDRLCELLDAAQLQDLNASLKKDGRKALESSVKAINERLEREKMEMMERSRGEKGDKASGGGGGGGSRPWSSDELALLIKAVNLFPAGTNQRWEVVASFINQHSKTPEIQRLAKETLSKAKEMQQQDYHANVLKEEANKNAYENLERNKKRDVKVETEASTRTESAAEAQGLNVRAWSPEEQQLLEQALKTYPSSLGAGRWDKIAECIPDRSKKDCMRRYKELAEIVRAKKAAQAAAAASATKK